MHTRQLPSGRWRVIVQVDGVRRSAVADTKRAANTAGAKLQLALEAEGPARRAAKTTVADLIGNVLAERDQTWSPTYLADVEAVLDRLPEKFTDQPATAIRPRDIDALYRQLRQQGWTPHRIRRLHEVLSAAWKAGARRELVASNILTNVAKPAPPARDLTIPTHGDVAAIIQAVHGVDRIALRLAAATGARRGELVALQWRDVALDTGTITIRRSLRYTKATGITEGATKTGAKGHRSVIVDGGTRAALADWCETQVALPRASGQPQRWVLSDDGGVSYWRPDRLTHVFAAACKRAGIRHVRLHDLRHYVATTMLQQGVPPLEVAAQLGHTTPETVFRVYAHYLPGIGGDAAEARAAHWG